MAKKYKIYYYENNRKVVLNYGLKSWQSCQNSLAYHERNRSSGGKKLYTESYEDYREYDSYERNDKWEDDGYGPNNSWDEESFNLYVEAKGWDGIK